MGSCVVIALPSGVSEQLTEEELALFDILTKPEINITAKEKEEVKQVARMLLQTLKEAKLVLDWWKKQRSRADVFTTVKTVLDELPRAYTPELYLQKCDTVYQHVYDSYQGEGRSIYAMRWDLDWLLNFYHRQAHLPN